MSALLPDVDPDGLLEYSVVYTDRSLNHMSVRFQQVMRDIHATLTEVYSADHAVVVPGGGSIGMEAVARQFARGKRCLVIRNGWFSYRWSQIFEAGNLPESHEVLCAQPTAADAETAASAGRAGSADRAAYAPPPIEEVIAFIEKARPERVFAPHVETSAGLMLPDDYLEALAAAVHRVGGLLILDCVASGTAWVDMRARGVDVLISAPQKGWSGTPCAGLVMLGKRALDALETSTSDSFALDLKKWSEIMNAYLGGKHAYHATLPTDGLVVFRDVMSEIRSLGFDTVHERQVQLGQRVRAVLAERGFASVAADGFHAHGVAVYHTDDDELNSGRAFAAEGLQIAAGVPLQIGEPEGFKTFRIGLFGLDKLLDVDAAVSRFEQALDRILAARNVTGKGPEGAAANAR